MTYNERKREEIIPFFFFFIPVLLHYVRLVQEIHIATLQLSHMRESEFHPDQRRLSSWLL